MKGLAVSTGNIGTRTVEEVKGPDPRLRAEAVLKCAVALKGGPFIFRKYPAKGLGAQVHGACDLCGNGLATSYVIVHIERETHGK